MQASLSKCLSIVMVSGIMISFNHGSGFDLPTFVQTAFKKLQSDVHLVSEVSIGKIASIFDLRGL